MFKLFSNSRLTVMLVLASLSTIGSSLMANCCESYDRNRFYIGGFGGGLFSNSTKLSQMGTAYFTEAEGGPLAVFAQGHTKKTSTGFGGVQLGYEWSPCPYDCECPDWIIAPAAEVEAYFYGHKKKGHLINPTARLPEHDFADSFHMNSVVCLANIVLSVKSPFWCKFSPYVGGGIGAARISIRDAKSLQVAPVELGINHFNSQRSDSSWAFAAQAKAGLRYNICDRFHVFAEYRYLYIDCSNYILGSTVYPTHAATSPWNFKIKDINYNAFAVGFQFDLY